MNQVVITELLGIAHKHRHHLGYSRQILSSMVPLTVDQIEMLSEKDIALWDAFVMRFCMLQDLMEMKLFDAFLLYMGQDPTLMSIIDKINALEKQEIIQEAQLWKDIRKIRNKLTHEYPNAPILAADVLNQAFKQVDTLHQILDAITARVQSSSEAVEGQFSEWTSKEDCQAYDDLV